MASMYVTPMASLPEAGMTRAAQIFPALEGEPDACWLWKGRLDRSGYGTFRWGSWRRGERREVGAHRAAYIFYVGTVPSGLVLDHLCRNRACVNPSHLEPVTIAENVRRGTVIIDNRIALNYVRPIPLTCRRGHALDAENTLVSVGKDGYSRRACRECAKAGYDRWRARHAA